MGILGGCIMRGWRSRLLGWCEGEEPGCASSPEKGKVFTFDRLASHLLSMYIDGFLGSDEAFAE